MAIPPLDPKRLNSGVSGETRGKRSNLSNPEARAAEEERRAQARIAAAQQQATEAEREGQHQVDNIRDEYVRRVGAQAAREEEGLDEQRLKGYAAMRNLKRQQDAEVNRVRRDGEQQLSTIKNYYRDAIYAEENRAKQEFNELRTQNAREMEFERGSANISADASKAEHLAKMEFQKNEQQTQYEQMKKASTEDYEHKKAAFQEQSERADTYFKDRMKSIVEERSDAVNRVQAKADRELTNLRKDSTWRLNAYASRQADPFYRMVTVDSSMHDAGDAYVVVASIPEHEQQNINVSIRGDQVVIAGSRKNQERLSEEPGKTITTSAYQSFSESFPISWPVDAKKITREYDNGRLVVKIPKKELYQATPTHQSKDPDKLRPERPKFPVDMPRGPFKEMEDEDLSEAELAVREASARRGKQPLSRS